MVHLDTVCASGLSAISPKSLFGIASGRFGTVSVAQAIAEKSPAVGGLPDPGSPNPVVGDVPCRDGAEPPDSESSATLSAAARSVPSASLLWATNDSFERMAFRERLGGMPIQWGRVRQLCWGAGKAIRD